MRFTEGRKPQSARRLALSCTVRARATRSLAHLHGAPMRHQSFGIGQRRHHGRQAAQARRATAAARSCSARNPRWKARRASARRRRWAARDWCRWRNRRSIARSRARETRCPRRPACRTSDGFSSRNAQMLRRKAIGEPHRRRGIRRQQDRAVFGKRPPRRIRRPASALSCSATASRTAAASVREVVTRSATASGSCSACATRSAAI